MLFESNLEIDEARLSWQCRRGMLELDLMLDAFVTKRYTSLSLKDKQAFHQLLKCQDQILLEYLMGKEIPADKDVAHVAQQVRDAAGPDA